MENRNNNTIINNNRMMIIQANKILFEAVVNGDFDVSDI